MPNINISKELYEKIKQEKESKSFNTYSEAVESLLNNEPEIQEVETADNLELVLAETKQDESKDLQELFSNENIEKKTDLSAKQVMALAKAKTFADRYKNKPLDDFINRFVTYAVSKERKGRKEFVESFKAKILEPLGLGALTGGAKNENNESK